MSINAQLIRDERLRRKIPHHGLLLILHHGEAKITGKTGHFQKISLMLLQILWDPHIF